MLLVSVCLVAVYSLKWLLYRLFPSEAYTQAGAATLTRLAESSVHPECQAEPATPPDAAPEPTIEEASPTLTNCSTSPPNAAVLMRLLASTYTHSNKMMAGSPSLQKLGIARDL